MVRHGLEINYGLDARCSDVGTLRRLICVVLWGFRLAEGPRDEGTAVFVWIGGVWEKGLTIVIKVGLYKMKLRWY